MLRTLHALGQLPPPSPQPPGHTSLTTVADGTGRERRCFGDISKRPMGYMRPDSRHIFESQFAATKHGFVENVLGGILQFTFEHTPGSSKQLQPRVSDMALCEDLYRKLPESLAPALPAGQSCLALDMENAEWGWMGRSTSVRGMFGMVPLPHWASLGMRVEDVNIAHADGRGWFVQVRLTCAFGLLTSYTGHVRMPAGWSPGDES